MSKQSRSENSRIDKIKSFRLLNASRKHNYCQFIVRDEDEINEDRVRARNDALENPFDSRAVLVKLINKSFFFFSYRRGHGAEGRAEEIKSSRKNSSPFRIGPPASPFIRATLFTAIDALFPLVLRFVLRPAQWKVNSLKSPATSPRRTDFLRGKLTPPSLLPPANGSQSDFSFPGSLVERSKRRKGGARGRKDTWRVRAKLHGFLTTDVPAEETWKTRKETRAIIPLRSLPSFRLTRRSTDSQGSRLRNVNLREAKKEE